MERRKYPRYPIRLKVYFPHHQLWGHTTNVSLDGCFIEMEGFLAQGFLTDFLLELPIVGVIALKGYIHHSGEEQNGLGMQFVQVRFSPEDSEYYSIYAEFLTALPKLERTRLKYLEMVQKGLLKLQSFPDKS